MVKAKLKVKFPCGYEYEGELSSSNIFANIGGHLNDEEFPLCPLHGKNCPNKKKTR